MKKERICLFMALFVTSLLLPNQLVHCQSASNSLNPWVKEHKHVLVGGILALVALGTFFYRSFCSKKKRGANFHSPVFPLNSHGMPQEKAQVSLNGVCLKHVHGDICQCRVAAIVNAANKDLKGGSGVCGAIFKAAGHTELEKECSRLSPIQVGEAVITSSCRLATSSAIKHIIHAVGPDCRVVKNQEEQDKLLAFAYDNVLKRAIENNIPSVAIPCLSTGVYGFDTQRAAEIAFKVVQCYCSQSSLFPLKEIQLVTYTPQDYDKYTKLFSLLKLELVRNTPLKPQTPLTDSTT